ncbi:MAG: aminoglycoside phosphotransferase, partial [Verrucomicrobia bacterium]|nr:aminoglycoside phosphotransferase [Verrucomicrobiota bacterium]
LKVVGGIVPGSVPNVLFAHPTDGWFAMEFLGDGFSNWKSLLLEQRAEPEHARRAGEVMGRIHHRTWGDASLAREFATLANFRQLRLEPYLETTADRVPELAALLRAESARLASTSLALVHGDFSPKNILLSPGRFVLLDAEVGWFGDPVFDVAFLVNHFFLKALLHSSNPAPLLALVPVFWGAYTAELGAKADVEFERRVVRLLLCLLLARVHGKSPVEYLPESGSRTWVTEFVQKHLPQPPSQLAELAAAWRAGLLHR